MKPRRPGYYLGVVCLWAGSLTLTGCPPDPVVPPPKPNEPQVCFPGATQRACLPILKKSPPEALEYPKSTDIRYAVPSVWLDLVRLGPDIPLSEHFTLGELTNKDRGQHASLQPFAIEKLQRVRDAVGSIRVTSGYRNPAHNRAVGGAPLSRHQYGDGFDLVPLESTQAALQKACDDAGATFTMAYADGHVHCDWRDGATRSLEDLDLSTMIAGLTRGTDGRLTVEAEGFDEGPPTMTWRALDAEGNEMSARAPIKWRSRTASGVDRRAATGARPGPAGVEGVKLKAKPSAQTRTRGIAFTPPPDYAVVELMIGGRIVVMRTRSEIESTEGGEPATPGTTPAAAPTGPGTNTSPSAPKTVPATVPEAP